VGRVVKVKSDRDLVDSGIKALVDALGYSGAARFLRHFSKGEGDYLVIQEKLFKGMDLEQIYKKAKDHHRAKPRKLPAAQRLPLSSTVLEFRKRGSRHAGDASAKLE
jgi:hypothetical protein